MTAYTIRNVAGRVVGHTDHATVVGSLVWDEYLNRETLRLDFRATDEDDGREIVGRFVRRDTAEDDGDLLAWVTDPGPVTLVVDTDATPVD